MASMGELSLKCNCKSIFQIMIMAFSIVVQIVIIEFIVKK